MSIFSGISHLVSGAWDDVFGGGSDQDKKKKQQQFQAPSKAPNFAPGANNTPDNQPVQPQAPELNLTQLSPQKAPDAPKVNAQTLAKAKQFTQDNTPAPKPVDPSVLADQEAAQKNSLSYKLTHNPVTDVVGSAVKPVAEFGNAVAHVPEAIGREVQNKPIDDINQQVFGTSDPRKVAEHILGDTASVGLTVLAPGADAGAEALGQTALRKAPEVVQNLAPKVAGNAAVGAGFGASNALREGEDPGQALKDTAEGAVGGGVLGGAFAGIPLLRKFGPQADEISSPATGDIGEVAPGVKSVNPTKDADAAEQMAAKAAAEQPPVAPEAPQAANAAKPGEAPVQPAEAAPTAVQPAEPAPSQPVAPVAAPGAEVPAPQPAPVEVSAQPAVSAPEGAPAPVVAPVAPGETPALPEVPPAQGGQTLPVAPRTHDALVNQVGEAAADLKGGYGQRAEVNLDDLKDRAAGVVANIPDDDLLKAFGSVSPEEMVRDPNSQALARAALDKAAQMPDNPQAVQTVTNIMDALSQASSRSGLMQRLAQEDFDNMPLPMKVRYIAKSIDRANAGVEGYAPLSDDPARAQIVENTITGYLRNSETINERVAAAQGQLNDVAEAAKNGQRSEANIKPVINGLKSDQRELEANNGELVKYYQSLMPKRSLGQRSNDFARNMMLASFTGRVNDLMTTATNVGHLGLQNVTQGLLAKAVNAVKPGAAVDTLRGIPDFFRGSKAGVSKGVDEFSGTQFSGNLQKALKNNTDIRSGVTKARGPVGRTVQAATELATRASEGVTDQRLYQLAVQEGQQTGLKGDLLKQYAQARSAVPSSLMREKADQLHLQVNNLNDNPITAGLNRVSQALAVDQPGIPGTVGGIIRNQIIPFTSWLGGNIWNSLTDKNVAASLVKTLASASKGDVDGVVENLAKTANNAAYTYALGYLLTQTGVITNKDAQGYNDAGAYFHIGGRYIPVAFSGFFAPNIILGNAAYQGLNDNGNGGTADKIGTFASQSLLNWMKSANALNALGTDNNVSRAFSSAQQPGSTATAGDIGAQLGGGVAGQYIPAATGDVNAVLNNGLKIGGKQVIPDTLNPTHEAADTKATKTSAAGNQVKDQVGSAIRSLENRVPLVSQGLPRKAGVAASDLVDRVTHGNRDTNATVQKAKDEASAQNQAASDKAKDIPDPNGKYAKGDSFDNAVEARIEKGDYDKASAAYQQKLDAQKKDSNIPASKNKELQDKITTLKVLKDGGYDPKIIDQYKKTSVSEWRDMGDPDSDSYDPKTYELLYRYDSALAKDGVSSSSTDPTDNKYTAKKASTSGRGSAASKALSQIKGNTVSSPTDLKNIDFGKLAPEKAGSIKIPTIQKLTAAQEPKKRTISVRKAG